jgi:hypothetical protein
MGEPTKAGAGEPILRQGVLVAAGTHLRLADLRFTIDDAGELQSSLRLELALDVFPHWMAIALGHAEALESAHTQLLAAWPTPDEGAVHAALEAEFLASMQAITATAIAWDALYDTVQRVSPISTEITASWRHNRTARYQRLGEVLRRGFRIGNASAVQLRLVLKETFKYRGWSVHPPAAFSTPAHHPELNVQTEWRFAAFRHFNAHHTVRAAIALIPQLMTRPRAARPELVKFCGPMLPRMKALVERWEDRFGMSIEGEARGLLGLVPRPPAREA